MFVDVFKESDIVDGDKLVLQVKKVIYGYIIYNHYVTYFMWFSVVKSWWKLWKCC